MGRHTFFVTIALTVVWCILMEEISWQNVGTGLFMSLLSLHFVGRFFHFDEIKRVAFLKLAIYPFWLLARIYVDAIFLMRLILSNAKWGIMTADLKLENESLRIMLADSITLTPGSVYLERTGKKITLLCIGDRKKEGYPASMDDLRSIEKMLIRSEIPEKWEKKIQNIETH